MKWECFSHFSILSIPCRSSLRWPEFTAHIVHRMEDLPSAGQLYFSSVNLSSILWFHAMSNIVFIYIVSFHPSSTPSSGMYWHPLTIPYLEHTFSMFASLYEHGHLSFKFPDAGQNLHVAGTGQVWMGCFKLWTLCFTTTAPFSVNNWISWWFQDLILGPHPPK